MRLQKVMKYFTTNQDDGNEISSFNKAIEDI